MKRLIENLSNFWPFLAIFFLWLIFALPYFFKDITPFPSAYLVTRFPPWQYFYTMPVKNPAMPDVLSQLFPWRKLVLKLWKQGELPLWNPYLFSGTPLLANYQSAVFHPLNLLFFFFSFPFAWKILILLQPLLAGIFTYLFCQSLALSPLASLLSSLSFAFCGFIVCWMAYGTLGYALLFLPFALLGVERKRGFVLSFALVCSLFSGHFQTSLYVMLATFLYLLFKTFRSKNLLFFLHYLSFVVFALLLTAPLLFPTAEFYLLAPRSRIFQEGEIIPFPYLITLLAPDFFGNPVTRNDWFGHYAEWAGFIGTVPLIFALYSLFKPRKATVWFFAFLSLFALIFSLPTPFSKLLFRLKIPVLSTSAASRIISLFSFSVAILAGFGFECWWKDVKDKKFGKIFAYLAIFGLFFLGIWLFLLFFSPLPLDKISIARRNFILPSIMFFSLFSSILLFSLFPIKLFSLLPLFCLCLSFFDLFRFGKKWLPVDPEKLLYPPLPVIEFLKSKAGIDRVFGNFGNELAVSFEVFSPEGYDPLYLARYGELISSASLGQIGSLARSTVYLDKRGKYTVKILNLLGVKYLLHAKDDDRHIWAFPFWEHPEQFEEIYSDEKYQVFENKKALPRAFLAYDYRTEKSKQDILAQMYSLDLEKTVVLEEDPRLAKCRDCWGEVEIEEYQPNRILLTVSSPQKALLFLSDNFYPGWKAFVDGKRERILRANYSFRAVVVPRGRHRVVFLYQPDTFLWGMRVSLVSLLFFLAKSIRNNLQDRQSFPQMVKFSSRR